MGSFMALQRSSPIGPLCANTYTTQEREVINTPAIHKRFNTEKRHQRSPTARKEQGVLLAAILRHQKIRRFATSIRSKALKHTDSAGKIQDGIPTNHHSIHPGRRLAIVSRSGRCVSPRPHTCALSEILKICSRRKTFSVPGITIWHMYGAKNVHENIGDRNSISKGAESASTSLPGRRVINSGFRTQTNETQGHPRKHITTVWLDNKSEKEPVRAESNIDFSGGIDQYEEQHCIPAGRQESTGQTEDIGGDKTSTFTGQAIYENSGHSFGDNSHGYVGSMEHENMPEQLLEAMEWEGPISKDPFSTQHEVRTNMVATGSQPQQESQYTGHRTLLHNNRCKSLGLGSPHRREVCTRYVERACQWSPRECVRDSSSTQRTSQFQEGDPEQSGGAQNGQLHSCLIHKQPGGNAESVATKGGLPDYGIGATDTDLTSSSTHTGNKEHISRHSKQKVVRQQRVGIEPGSVLSNLPEMGSTGSGPHGNPEQHQMSEIPFQVQVFTGLRLGCTNGEVGFSTSLCLPSSPPHLSSAQANNDGENNVDCGNTILAEKALVSDVEEISGGTSMDTTMSQKFTDAEGHTSSGPQGVGFNGLEAERSKLTALGCSEAVTNTLLKARKDSTNKTYHRVWNKFRQFTKDRTLDANDPEIPTILEFLQRGVDMGLGSRTIKVQISALSALLDRRLATHPLILQFTRAVSKLRPAVRNLYPQWDLPTVLRGLAKPPFVPLEQCNLTNLTLKIVFLVAIASARRVSEIQALGWLPPYLHFFPDRVTLRPVPQFIPKVATNFHFAQEWNLPVFIDKESETPSAWNIPEILKQYVEITKPLRKSDRLFIIPEGYRRGQAASIRTIATWLVRVIRSAYSIMEGTAPTKVTAHSTRSISASWAAQAGVSAEVICRAANWASANTFVKHYKVDPAASSTVHFGKSIFTAATMSDTV
ncbi:uncharacterized protein [Hyperolius riggenbachi]|uniref:uncharacterized protein isoform X1 n=1 Tax=Hyperolius riggenbachi TaxID=752182 RepID=UPI0035A28923